MRKTVPLLFVFALLTAACGGDDGATVRNLGGSASSGSGSGSGTHASGTGACPPGDAELDETASPAATATPVPSTAPSSHPSESACPTETPSPADTSG